MCVICVFEFIRSNTVYYGPDSAANWAARSSPEATD